MRHISTFQLFTFCLNFFYFSILDEFGHEMDNTESRMDVTMKKMAKVMHMSNGMFPASQCMTWLPLIGEVGVDEIGYEALLKISRY
jgi:hypothetical protein